MSDIALPVFPANTPFHQNLGILKVAELAWRQHGDCFVLHAGEAKDLHVLAGLDSLRYWKTHQGHFHAELGDLPSNAGLSRMLLGEQPDDPGWSEIWTGICNRVAAVATVWDAWFDSALAAATRSFLAEITPHQPIDLRALCRLWSIRAVCPVLFGTTLSDVELAAGLALVERFFFAMNTGPADAEALPEFRAARGFLDRLVAAGVEAARPGDATVVAWVNAALPPAATIAERVAWLRPSLGRMLLEKLNIDGLSLLWTLVELAEQAETASSIAAEIADGDPLALADAATPLSLAAVKEGQRLYPELPFIYRITSQNVQIGGYTVPARATVLFAPWLIQRDPRYWADPVAFRPGRFLDPATDCSAYFPFGVGPRVRVRATFIQHQLTVAVRTVCATHALRLAAECRRGNLRPILRSTLTPRGAVPVVFTPRNPAVAGWGPATLRRSA